MPAKQKEVTFHLLPRAYDDPEYDENKSSVWVSNNQYSKNQQKGLAKNRTNDDNYSGYGEADDLEELFGNEQPEYFLKSIMKKDLPEDFTKRRNMLEDDDTREGDEVFEDAQEAEFDTDFIREMIYGNPGKEDDQDKQISKTRDINSTGIDNGDDNGLADDNDYAKEYPKHEVNRAIDKQFEKMINEFEVDKDINDYTKQDVRVQGALSAEQYAPVMEEFVDAQAEYNMLSDEPIKHQNLLKGVQNLTRRHPVFDSDAKGEYVFSVLPDKATRQREALKINLEDAAETTLKLLKTKEALPEQEENLILCDIKTKPKRTLDCETVVSTYSTLYNHPNIISASKKKIDSESSVKQNKAARCESEAADNITVQPGSEDEDDENITVMDISVRPKNETKEEKKLRRQLVKEIQKERRQKKNEVADAFKRAGISHSQKAAIIKQQKAQISLSLSKGI